MLKSHCPLPSLNVNLLKLRFCSQTKQIASLAIRSGNGLLLKGGKEARRSNAILHKVITDAIPETVGGKLIGLVTSREEIPDLLKVKQIYKLGAAANKSLYLLLN